MRKTVSCILHILLLVGMAAFVFKVEPVKAWTGTVYIRLNGDVDPSHAPIQRDGDVYTLTGSIISDADGIIIDRDNMTLDGAGYALQGTVNGTGILLKGRNNVTIRNLEIKEYWHGIIIDGSSNNTIYRNNIKNNLWYGVRLQYASNNNTISGNNITNNRNVGWGIGIWYMSNNNMVSRNNITDNKYFCVNIFWESKNNSIVGNNIENNGDIGIRVEYFCNDNTIVGNNIENNGDDGISVGSSSNNSILENNVVNNLGYGIGLYHSSANHIYHNNFIRNTQNAIGTAGNTNFWDDGYQGNYWSNYSGVDSNRDGIGDTPYAIGSDNIDHYPLMRALTPGVGDVNSDHKVSLVDIALIAKAWKSKPGDLNWNPFADIAPPYRLISLTDLVACAWHYAEHYP